MNAPFHTPVRKVSTVFKSNRSQAVRIPKELAFPEGVKDVVVIRKGKKLEIIPADALWDDFFAMLPADDDFAEPADLPPDPIEPF